MIIGFSGTRTGISDYQRDWLETMLDSHTPDKVLHGGCVGADACFHEICYEREIPIEIYPGYSANAPDDLRHRATDLEAEFIHPAETHFARNRKIVGKCDVLWACPFGDRQKGGTWYTINYARKMNVPVEFRMWKSTEGWDHVSDDR